MPASNPLWNDGTVQYGSRVITVRDYANNVFDSYVCDGFTMRRPAMVIKRKDQEGRPSGSAGVKDFVEGTANGIQLASSSTKEPLNGYTLTVTLDNGIGAETFIMHDIQRTESSTAETKLTANLIQKIN